MPIIGNYNNRESTEFCRLIKKAISDEQEAINLYVEIESILDELDSPDAKEISITDGEVVQLIRRDEVRHKGLFDRIYDLRCR